jgi:hypothetical protein
MVTLEVSMRQSLHEVWKFRSVLHGCIYKSLYGNPGLAVSTGNLYGNPGLAWRGCIYREAGSLYGNPGLAWLSGCSYRKLCMAWLSGCSYRKLCMGTLAWLSGCIYRKRKLLERGLIVIHAPAVSKKYVMK